MKSVRVIVKMSGKKEIPRLVDLKQCLHDSPFFREELKFRQSQINELETRVEKVVTVSGTMIEAGQTFSSSCEAFGHSLRDMAENFIGYGNIANNCLKACQMMLEIKQFYQTLFDRMKENIQESLKNFLQR